MRTPRHAAAATFALALVAALAGCSTAAHDRDVRAALERQLGRGVRPFGRPTVDIDDLQPLARKFYRERRYRAAWTTSRGPTADARELVRAVEGAGREGLDPAAYQLDSLRVAWRRAQAPPFGPPADPRRIAALDLRLTRTFLGLAAHLASGRVNPAKLPANWHVAPRRLDFVALLREALRGHRVGETLESLPPSEEHYARLRALLGRYRAIEARGGWRRVPGGPTLRLGSRGARVAALRDRLVATGDLAPGAGSRPVFDGPTGRALARFQRRHGLEPDEAVGADDLAALNATIERRIEQIELNLERWRWRARPLGERCIVVNVPGYSLEVRDRGRAILDMRVVVGQQFTPTPLFSDEITYLVLNPTWHVPQNIAANEMLPEVQANEHYLEENSIEVFDGPTADAKPVDPRRVNWRSMWPEDFRYALRQAPGPGNPLGRIKFMCPNQFDVYLHDTPAGHLFGAHDRSLSHGCVRVEKPVELASYLLYGDPGAGRGAVESAIAASRDSSLRVPRPIPVHLLYWTAWVDDAGEAQFRDDVYGLDRILANALGHAGRLAWLGSAGRR